MLSTAHLDRLGSQFKTALGLRGKGESAFGIVATGLLRDAAAFGTAYANGRLSEPGKQAYELGGIPADLLFGGLLRFAGLFDFFGKYSEAASILGEGISAPYVVRMGQIMGVNHKVAKATGTSPATRGLFAAGAPTMYPTIPTAPAVAGAFGPFAVGAPSAAPMPQAAWGAF